MSTSSLFFVLQISQQNIKKKKKITGIHIFGDSKTFKSFYKDPISVGRQRTANAVATGKGNERQRQLNTMVRSLFLLYNFTSCYSQLICFGSAFSLCLLSFFLCVFLSVFLSLFGSSHLQLKRVMLRRLKETIQNLLSMKSESVVFCKMSSLQRRCYQRVLDSPDYQLLLRKDEPCDCGRPDQTRGKCCHGGGGGGGDSRNQKKLLKSKTKTKRSAGGILWQSQHQDINGRFVECEKCPSCLTLLCLPKLMQLCNHCELIKPVWKQILFFFFFWYFLGFFGPHTSF